MGGPLARNLIRAGKEVYIYGRNQQHINKVLSAGTTGKAVKNINDLAICDIIFTCLPRPQTVKSIMIENNGLLNQLKSGSIYIDTSTIDPSTAIEIEQYAIHHNVHYIACTLGLGIYKNNAYFKLNWFSCSLLRWCSSGLCFQNNQ